MIIKFRFERFDFSWGKCKGVEGKCVLTYRVVVAVESDRMVKCFGLKHVYPFTPYVAAMFTLSHNIMQLYVPSQSYKAVLLLVKYAEIFTKSNLLLTNQMIKTICCTNLTF